MTTARNLEDYCQKAVENGATHALVTQPKLIITAPWVRLKCMYGCPFRGKYHCCPPYTPTPEQTRQIIDSYNRAILFHLEWTKSRQRGSVILNYFHNVVALEGELFRAGFYKAFAMLAGPCTLCGKAGCAVLTDEPCRQPGKARPCMEALGIDVFQTAHLHNLPLYTLQDEEETRNMYCVLLVD